MSTMDVIKMVGIPDLGEGLGIGIRVNLEDDILGVQLKSSKGAVKLDIEDFVKLAKWLLKIANKAPSLELVVDESTPQRCAEGCVALFKATAALRAVDANMSGPSGAVRFPSELKDIVHHVTKQLDELEADV